ncbi:plasmid stabilization protein [Asticcacaulis endophyticus]|uniref:Plasmid stabilization protein n=2 Tax=Asticcacaulis endophyticus TaxID=1395890 RepID=A0A918Q3D5_9CAUL|nr:plasmid stabilization protein [Asticcacaulis endophyticus]
MVEIIWTETAAQDLDDIGSYIALDSPRSAERVVRRIVESVAGLSFYPKIGRVGTEPDTRLLVVSGTPYIAVYRLRERIEILTVYHASRKFPFSS